MGSVLTRNCVTVSGVPSGRPMVFAHGFGCDQAMWRFVAPDFEVDHRVVLFDHVGAGRSDLTAYDPEKYGSLRGYASDIVEICRELDLRDVVFVGHSVSAMIGVLALPGGAGAVRGAGDGRARTRATSTTATTSAGSAGPTSPGCSTPSTATTSAGRPQMAPVIMGNHPEHPELAEELTNSFCRTDPDIARQFARVTFLSDNRADLADGRRPDAGAAVQRGRHRARRRRAVRARARSRAARSPSSRPSGTCPHLSAPEETTAAIRAFLPG